MHTIQRFTRPLAHHFPEILAREKGLAVLAEENNLPLLVEDEHAVQN
jgi:hypothetical protein